MESVAYGKLTAAYELACTATHGRTRYHPMISLVNRSCINFNFLYPKSAPRMLRADFVAWSEMLYSRKSGWLSGSLMWIAPPRLMTSTAEYWIFDDAHSQCPILVWVT